MTTADAIRQERRREQRRQERRALIVGALMETLTIIVWTAASGILK